MVNGFSMMSGAGSNNALGFIRLEHWDDRKDPSQSVEAIIGQLFQLAGTIADAEIIFFEPPSVPGFGASAGFEVNVLDRLGGRSEEHTSELQSRGHLVCRLLLEKKKEKDYKK